MDFCNVCQNLFQVNSTLKSSFEHYKSPQELAESALNCKLCLYFIRAIVIEKWGQSVTEKRGFKDQPHHHQGATDVIQEFLRHLGEIQWGPVNVYFSGNKKAMSFQTLSYDRMGYRQHGQPPSRTNISVWIKSSFGDYHSLHSVMSLYAHRDSPAAISGDVGGRPLLTAPNAVEASELIKSWIEGCMKYHPECRELTDGSEANESLEPCLPTRVLYLRGEVSNIQPQLLVTSALRGRYTALSHCWGQAQPLATTKVTLAQRLFGIPWESLPQTFKDAMIVTKSIGLNYIWIDSLCIIQDDHDDWMAEAERMGDVYENAHLTIMATHARDGTDGLFTLRPEAYSQLEIPYFTASRVLLGSIFLTLPFNTADDIDKSRRGPLTSRGWVTRELLLSRRAVSYTPERLIWVCKTLQAAEDGGITEAPHDHDASAWENLVRDHTKRKLTYEKDRLISLEGIVNKRKDATGDEYHWGLWQKNIHEQLLWYREKRPDGIENSIHAPSWSWACNEGEVNFSGYRSFLQKSLKGQIPSIQIVDKVLTLRNCQLNVLSSIEEFEIETPPYPFRVATHACFDNERPAIGQKIICAKIVGGAFLFLEPVLDKDDTFRRIGFGYVWLSQASIGCGPVPFWFVNAIEKTIYVV